MLLDWKYCMILHNKYTGNHEYPSYFLMLNQPLYLLWNTVYKHTYDLPFKAYESSSKSEGEDSQQLVFIRDKTTVL